MTSPPPPHGINDVDYEAIEAAVTETVRGRWFLNEFARRNRTSEMRQLLEAMARVETTLDQGRHAVPAADPSIRLLVQRIKEIAGHLDGLSRDMREAGVDERFCDAADLQARAVSGMMRNNGPGLAATPLAPAKATAPKPALVAAPPMPAAPVAPVEPPLETEPAIMRETAAADLPDDPRLAALSEFDDLPFAKKLALFT